MRKHEGVSRLLREAELNRRCAIGDGGSLYHAMRRRVQSLELVSPYPNLFADRAYWQALDVDERHWHVVGALAICHPQWTFAGLSAACIYGYQHAHTLHDGTVHIASTGGICRKGPPRLHRTYMSRIPRCRYRGVSVTSPARTLVDCASMPFANALAIYDSALRSGSVTVDDIATEALLSNRDESPVRLLLQHADPKSENGGESLSRGKIIDCGFATPQLQIEFPNPDNPDMPYRVDFCWRLHDGRIIAAEYDGMAKYADVSNANRASLQAKLDYERRRERHLRERGVMVVHLFYEDVINTARLEAKLLAVGVPKVR
ncbi:hypothetical protein EHS19_10380 [Bifidobacterium jacchi]|uniref:CTP synthase n=2 Tax=Bifidobacterium jacchi TaxID=2490545 RepID=A0A5N5RE73_9BIFI|nr:hypothetical protein EHS19_10380 [Bifidobacterium jacchi]